MFQYFNVVYVNVERISDARRTFVGCGPNNCVKVVIYIRINMYFWEISTNNKVTNRDVFKFQSWKDFEVYIDDIKIVFCYVFSLSVF